MKKTAEILDDPVIQIENLVKEYKSSDGTIIRAVNNVSMSVAPGEIVGLLGANGAGKTTTMQMLTGAIKPTDGDAKILGESISTNMGNVKKYVGLCPQHNVLWDQLTV